MSIKPPRRALFLALIILALALSLTVQNVYAPFGDAQIGFVNPTANNGTAQSSGVGVQNRAWMFAFQNLKGDANIVGYYVSEGNIVCGPPYDAVAVASFPVGYTPSLSGINILANQNMRVLVNNISPPLTCGNIEPKLAFSGLFIKLNQWVVILFHVTTGNGAVWDFTGASPPDGNTPSVGCIPSITLAVFTAATTFTTGDGPGSGCIVGGTPIVGLDISFSQQGSTTGTQCIGNCGTLANTNSTHSINFNQSLTIFYQQQVQISFGTVVNETIQVAKTYAPSAGMTLFFGLYSTNGPCPGLSPPFTQACPGYLINSVSIINPKKQQYNITMSYGVQPGQWLAPAFSASTSGLDLNDTATAFPSYQTSGSMPVSISNFANNGNLKANLKVNIVSTTQNPSGGGGGCPANFFATLDCILPNVVNGFCQNPTTGCQTGSSFIFIFGLSILSLFIVIYFIGQTAPGVNLNAVRIGDLAVLIFLGWFMTFAGIGLVPTFMIILVFFVVSWLFMGRIKGTGPI